MFSSFDLIFKDIAHIPNKVVNQPCVDLNTLCVIVVFDDFVKVRDIIYEPIALFINDWRLVHDGAKADDGLPGVVITIVESVNSIPK